MAHFSAYQISASNRHAGISSFYLYLCSGRCWLDCDPLNRDFPAISTTSKSFNVMRLFRGVAQRLTQTFHCGVDAVIELNYCVVGPKLPSNLLPQNHFARLFQ